MEHIGKAMNRRRLLQSAAALTASIPVIGLAGEAASARTTTLTGVAEVMSRKQGGLVVRLADGGRPFFVPAQGFGDTPARKGDLVAVLPDRPGGDPTRADSVSARPYQRVDAQRRVWRYSLADAAQGAS